MKITDKDRLDFIKNLIMNQGSISYEMSSNHLAQTFYTPVGPKRYEPRIFVIWHRPGKKFLEPLCNEPDFEEAIDNAIMAIREKDK